MSGTIHAGAALIGEHGVLIRGPSASGKSALILAILADDPAAHRLVSDDRVMLVAAHGRLLAAAPPSIAGLLEIRGLGIVRRPHVSPVRIDLVVDLEPPETAPRLPSEAARQTEVDGVVLPRLILAVGTSSPVARIKSALARPMLAEAANS